MISENCVICWESFDSSKNIIIFECNHLIHWDCITTWYEKSNSKTICLNCNVERDITSIIVKDGCEYVEETTSAENKKIENNVYIETSCCILM